MARSYLAARRRRDDLIGAGLFADPGWDILLDLYVNEMEGALISVSSACLASGVATSTALSWIQKLVSRGLVIRERDRRDGRRTFLRLTTEATDAIERWINATFRA